MTRQQDRLVIAAILLLALGLRIWGLNAPLWYDEIQTVDTHLRLSWAEMYQRYELNHHFLFNFQAKLAVELFGEQNWAIRLPALVFGVGSIWAVWVLARDLSHSKFAHIAALLLALSYHHIWFSQNARGYTEMAFWGTLGTVLFLRGLSHGGRNVWLGYAVTLAAAVFTHLTGAFIFAAHGLVWLFLLITSRGTPFAMPFRAFVLGAVLTIAAYYPLLPSLLETVGSVSGTSAKDVMQEYQNPVWTIIEGVRTAIGTTGVLSLALAGIMLVLLLTGGAYTGWVFVAILLAHIALTIVALLVLGMRIWPRFFFADIGLALILIVPGVAFFSDLIARPFKRILEQKRFFQLAVVLMVILSCALAWRNYTAPKQNLQGAVEYVAEIRRAGEPVYAITYSADLLNRHFGTDYIRLTDPTDLWKAQKQAGSKLFVVTFPQRSFRLFPGLRNQSYERLKVFPGTLGDGRILILRHE
jgi:4-amino-4-deoxy-L-arabinose transferase-like glycosyltransferase